jgi:ATP-dependent Lhr-like helicase
MPHSSLSTFHPTVAAWFERTYGEPSPPQAQGWPLIAAGQNVLLLAPTGSGKTFAAFLKCLDYLYQQSLTGKIITDGVSVLYISPLKALNNDIHRNLEVPLQGIADLSKELGTNLPLLTKAVRTGDTPAAERRRMLQKPPQILITTPESLFLMLSSQAREILKTVRYIIVDEIHTLFPNKRGAFLALSLERLQHLIGDKHPVQRIGLSATMRPLDQVAAFLGGNRQDSQTGAMAPRPVTIVDTGQRKKLDLQILLPVPDLRELPEKSIWPPIYEKLLELVNQHRTTLIFVNNRRQAERITAEINRLAGRELARTHHGSVSKEVRLEAEELLKAGKLPCVVATASLELGIDIGYIDLVVQIESPKEVARGLQRVGRAGHIVGMPSKGRIIPKTRADLLEAAAIIREMKVGRVEPAQAPMNCLDILAQQVVALTTEGEWETDEALQVVRGAYNYRDLGEREFEKVLEMLSGNYDATEFIDLKPRLYWDRLQGVIREEPYGKRLVYSSGGTIPDRGYFGVYLAGSGVKLGELDEEFVFERRLNERFVLGTSTWRIEEIRQDRVIVNPARKGEAYIPFWKADQSGRAYELGKRIGAFYEEVEARLNTADFEAWLASDCGIDGTAASNISQYLQAQKRAVGFIQTHRRLILETYPDEAGEWRVILHSPFGSKLHMALGYIIKDEWADQYGYEAEMIALDEALLFHCPASAEPPVIRWTDIPMDKLDLQVARTVASSVLFGTVFRHCAQRSLVMPRTGYGKKRTPLWLARLKAGNLLQIVAKYPDFPLIVETYREVLQDFFDLAGLKEVIGGIRQGEIEVLQCSHGRPSPFAAGYLLNFTGGFMYDSDAPKGEQRLQLFGLGRETLKAIVGEKGFRDLFAADQVREVSRKAQGIDDLAGDPSLERLQYWLERTGDVSLEELDQLFPSSGNRIKEGFRELLKSGGVVEIRFGPDERSLLVARVEAAVYGSALDKVRGLEPISAQGEKLGRRLAKSEARRRIIGRYARTHGPFPASAIAERYYFSDTEVAAELAVLAANGVVEAGEFIPRGSGEEWCDVGLLREIHRRSLAKARKEVEARSPRDFAAFLAKWQGVAPFHGNAEPIDQLEQGLKRLANLRLPAEALEKWILPARIPSYRAGLLDQLIGSGQFNWRAGASGSSLQVVFEPVEMEHLDWVSTGTSETNDPNHPKPENPVNSDNPVSSLTSNSLIIHEILVKNGALSLPQILKLSGLGTAVAWEALEELIHLGWITNDTFGPIRYILNTSKQDRQGVRGILKPNVMNAMGRWALLLPKGPESPESPEILAAGLLYRYGIVSREMASAEGLSWEGLYPVFDRWENAGKIRRGYFVEGLSGIQYALPMAVEQLRQGVEDSSFWALEWRDSANAYRLLLEWPGDSSLVPAPDYLVYQSGEPILGAAGKRLKIQTLKVIADDVLEKAFGKLVGFLDRVYGDERIVVVQLNGESVNETRIAPILAGLGFEKGYNEMTLWPSQRKR